MKNFIKEFFISLAIVLNLSVAFVLIVVTIEVIYLVTGIRTATIS